MQPHAHHHHSSGALSEQLRASNPPPVVNLPPIYAQHGMQHQPHPPPPPYAAPPNMTNGPQSQPQQQPQQQQHPPPFSPAQYQQYAPNGAMAAAAPMPTNVATNGQNGMMRYPIPPQPQSLDQRQMSGGRHKKEIKRRTKTGCLTCRKRRIKCDEGQPTCRNCQKSKRECLGYDPIFKQQPSPANIQPAPTGSSASPVIHQQVHTPNPSLPSNPYQQKQQQQQPPPPYQGASAAYVTAPGPPPAHSEQPHFEPHYSNGASLDPALSGGNQAQHMAPNAYPFAMQPTRQVRVVPMEDLFAIHDIPPRYNLREPPPPLTPAIQQELDHFWKFHYAAGLDRLFETTWYSQHGLTHLQRDTMLQDFVMQCAEQFEKREDATGKQTMSTEARLVWLLAIMPRNAQYHNGAGGDQSLYELLPRIDVMENLLTGGYLDPSRVIPPPQHQPPLPPGTDNATLNQKHNERAFWHHLARFTSLRDDQPSVTIEKDINEALGLLRNLLGMMENRDVIYSLAVGRHIGGRIPDFHPQQRPVPQSNDQSDPIGKLSVACTFVESEDARGTTQVIQRICSMAIRAWCLQKR